MSSMNANMILNSDSHNSKLVQTFSDLYKNNVLTDVTLVCEDRYRIEAHRMVLCASSPLLREFITINTQSHPLIYLKGVKGPNLSTIMQFLYTGEVSIKEEEMPSLLKLAKELEIVELQELKDNASMGKQKPNNVLKEEDIFLTPSVNTPSFLEIRENEQRVQNIIDSSYECGDCEYKGKSQKQLLEHVEMLHTVNNDYETNFVLLQDTIYEDDDAIHATNQETMTGQQQLNTEDYGLKTTVVHKSIKIYKSEVHREFLQTSIKNVGSDGKYRQKMRSECNHCGRVFSDNQASHLKDHLKKKHPEVFAAVQADEDQMRKMKMEEMEKDDGLKTELAQVQTQIQKAKTQMLEKSILTELFFKEAALKSKMLL